MLWLVILCLIRSSTDWILYLLRWEWVSLDWWVCVISVWNLSPFFDKTHSAVVVWLALFYLHKASSQECQVLGRFPIKIAFLQPVASISHLLMQWWGLTRKLRKFVGVGVWRFVWQPGLVFLQFAICPLIFLVPMRNGHVPIGDWKRPHLWLLFHRIFQVHYARIVHLIALLYYFVHTHCLHSWCIRLPCSPLLHPG